MPGQEITVEENQNDKLHLLVCKFSLVWIAKASLFNHGKIKLLLEHLENSLVYACFHCYDKKARCSF